MNSPLRPPIATILPPNAPFTPEQHELLNGFFAGLLEGDVAALSPQQAANLLPGGVYEEYGVPFLPALAMASAVLVYRAGSRNCICVWVRRRPSSRSDSDAPRLQRNSPPNWTWTAMR